MAAIPIIPAIAAAGALATLGTGYALGRSQGTTINNSIIDGSTAIILLAVAGGGTWLALKGKKK